MKTLGIIQARMGSTRLPNKVLMPLGKTVLLDYVYTRAVNIDGIDDVVIATTKNKEDDAIESWCKNRGIKCFRGSENDLLQRFADCITFFNPDYIVRITGDCPFISIELAELLINQTLAASSDYGRINSGNISIGLKVSIIKRDIILHLLNTADHPYYREHITLYLDENSSQFNITTVDPGDEYKEKVFRLTVDTQEDLIVCRKIVEHLGKDLLISSDKIIDFLYSNPHIAQINSNIKQRAYRVKNWDCD